MNNLNCLIRGCQGGVYSPAGTQNVCKEHFLNFLTWRRRKGPQMFTTYAGMTMEQRNPIVAEWANTIRIEESTNAPVPKS